jgi:hypothetical protein
VQSLEREHTSALAIWSLVCGLAEAALFGTSALPGGGSSVRAALALLVFSPFAIVLGVIGIRRCGRHNLRGRWMAVVGLLLGLAPWLILMALIILLLASGGEGYFDD